MLGSDDPQVTPTLPGDSRSGPRARSVDQQSLATRARLRGPAGSTSCPSLLGPCSEGPRGRPALPHDSCPAVIASGFNKLSRATQASVRGPTVSTSSAGRLALGSEVPWGRPDVRGFSGYGPRSRVVHQLSRATRARFRGPAGFTSIPRRLALRSMAHIVDQSPGRLGPMPEGLRARPDVPADLGPCSSACGVDQLSRATRAPVRWPARSTGSPGRLVRGSVGPRGRPVPQVTRAWAECRGVARFPGQLALGSEGPPFDKNSRVTRVRFFFPTESTTWPARLTPASEAPGGLPAVLSILGQCPSARVFRPALPGDSGPGPRAQGVDQLSRTTRARLC